MSKRKPTECLEEEPTVGWINLDQFAERLSLTLDIHGYPKIGRGKRLADDCGRTEGAVSRWLSGKSLPDIEPLLIIASKFNVSLDWLLLGIGDGPISASGPFMTASAMVAEVGEEYGAPPGEPVYGFRMSGPSMSPSIPPGSPLLFRVADRFALKSKGVYLFETNHGPIVRRIRMGKGTNVEVSCDNPRYESQTVSRRELFVSGDFRIRGEVLGMITKP